MPANPAAQQYLNFRLLICGNFLGENDGMNGQTIKTKELRDALVRLFGESAVTTVDTSSFFRRPAAFYLAVKRAFFRSTHVIVLPGPLAVHVLLPLLLRWKRKCGNDLRYVVIGGFLPDSVRKNPMLCRVCKGFDGIYVEAHAMVDRLRRFGLTNVRLLPNFRSYDLDMPRTYACAGRPLKLVFCARIFKEKGIEEATAAIDNVNENEASPLVTLDVFGPIERSYSKRFARLLATSRHTKYRGILPGAEVYTALQQYDLMIFPTYYYAEGFPGTILDAFIAGVPVLTTDWAYNAEIVQSGRTGAICRPKSTKELADVLRRYISVPQLLEDMRGACIDRARQCHIDHALKNLVQDLTSCPIAHREPVVSQATSL